MPVTTPQGTLDFKKVDRVTFVGASSNTVIDTTTGSLGVGVGVGGPTSNLHVVGDALITGNVSDLNVVSNVNMLHTSNTASIKLNSNVVAEFPRSKKLIKYPRVALTSDNQPTGYVASASSYYSSNSTYSPWKAFDGIEDGNSWISDNLTYTADGIAIGATAVDTFESIAGSWLGIELPNKIKLEYVIIRNRNSATIRNVKDGIIWAKHKTESTWYRIHDFSGLNTDSNAIHTIHVNQTNVYDEYRLQFTKIHPRVGGGAASIGELAFYGTPEYDPEAHGTDVTVKSYPNVPNTDWLEVYYDAKDLTDMPSIVADLAGGDQDASVYGVTLDTTNEAFVFNGSSYLETNIPQITTGVWPFTMSFWFKVNAHIGTTWNYLAHLGNRQGTAGDSTLVGLHNDQISITTWGDSKINSGIVATPGVWYHVTSTWPGGAFYDNAKLYINAVSYGDTDNTRDETSPLSFPTSGNKLTLGKQMNTTSSYFDGSIANFRLFNRALTSDEIYQLYAHQKEDFGHGDLSMTLKAGRLGIGTSEPRVALDVRGEIRAVGSMLYLLDTPLTHEWYWSGSTSTTTGSEQRIHYNQFPPNCRAIYADVFLPMASAADHGTHVLGESWINQGKVWTDGRSTTETTTNARPSTYMTTGVTQGAKVVYIGQPSQNDGFEYYYGNWWQSLIIPLGDGNNLYHGRAGYGSTNGWVYVYTKGYYV
jgi:hypothetical protein